MTNHPSDTKIAALEAAVSHHTVDTSGEQIHYAALGEGAPVLFIHGFPDHWLTWWHQMQALGTTHRVAAMDLRGFNLSAQPVEPSAYAIDKLIGDVAAVIDDIGAGPVTLIGHDWGGFVAWHVAMQRPDLVARLGIVNIPHPWAVARELVVNPAQVEASAYARLFQTPGARKMIPREQISAWVSDPAFKPRHQAAMDRSNLDAMLNYYRVLFPSEPYAEYPEAPPMITMPTLVIYGTNDPYLLADGLNGLWNYVSCDLTINAWADTGHFAQHEQPERLTQRLVEWLARPETQA